MTCSMLCRLAFAVAFAAILPAAVDLAGFGTLASGVAHADDDDDGGGAGGGSSWGGGERTTSGRASGRNILRGLRGAFRPRASGRRAVAAAPMPSAAPGDIIAVGLGADETRAIEAAGFTIVRAEPLAAPGASIVKLSSPSGMALEAAVDLARQRAPGATVDVNHYYRPGEGELACRGGHCAAPLLVGWPFSTSAGACAGDGLRIGLIDTAINAQHAAFAGGGLEIARLSDSELAESGRQHGTAVAALIVGRPESSTPGLLPMARLIAVDVFHRGERRDDRAEAFDLVRGLDLLRTKGVAVINLSLAGPPNTVVEQAVGEAIADGIVLVAAAGNDGPRATPRFPAAYDEVIAVTAVDRRKRAWRRAVQGEHIDLAAPGVDVWAAASVSGARPRTGTSFAAPFVTAAAALAVRQGGTGIAERLTAAAEDLGKPGKDPVFGHGLLNAKGLCG